MTENNNYSQQNMAYNNNADEQEIDLIELVKRLWHKRKFIIYVTCAFIVLGLFVALFSAKQYTAECLFVPQTTAKTSSSMSSLASLAGINLSQMGSSGELSPVVYPQIISNINFRKELMHSKVKFEEWDEPITLLDYYTNEEYAKFSLIGTIKKYTIGLPGVILGAIRGEQPLPTTEGTPVTLITYTKEEFLCSKIIGELISLSINDKDGYLQLSVNMPEAVAAAQVAEITFALLEKYVTEFKIQKAQANLDYVNDRLAEAEEDFEEKQLAYANFKDSNRMISTATASIEEDRLRKEYDLANTIYTELARQKTQQELQVKEDTPVLTIVKPVVVPFERSKPKRAMIMVAFTFLGACFGCGGVLGLDFLKKQGSNWPKNWKVED